MRKRCASKHKDYGGRGIKVCRRWQDSFEAFLRDMGPRPSPQHSVDRKNNSGDYTPKNCRWATREEQASNTRRNHVLTIDGKTQTLVAWAREFGIDHRTILMRLRHRWSAADAVQIPVNGRPRNLARGSRHPRAKLDEKKVAQLRAASRDEAVVLAAKFGITWGNARRIRGGTAWKVP
jgi:hypothetical protein